MREGECQLRIAIADLAVEYCGTDDCERTTNAGAGAHTRGHKIRSINVWIAVPPCRPPAGHLFGTTDQCPNLFGVRPIPERRIKL